MTMAIPNIDMTQGENAIEVSDGDDFIFMDETAVLPFVCCDCGLTHLITTHVEDDKVVMTVSVDRDVTAQIRSEAAVISNEFGEWTSTPPAIEGWWWMSAQDREEYKYEAVYVFPKDGSFYATGWGEVAELSERHGVMWCPAVQPPTREDKGIK